MNIIEELTCKHCHEIYDEPVTLNCCGDNVCKKHIDELLSHSLVENTFVCALFAMRITKTNAQQQIKH